MRKFLKGGVFFRSQDTDVSCFGMLPLKRFNLE